MKVGPPVRILFVDHTAELGGAEIALLRLVSRLDRERFCPTVLLFGSGALVPQLQVADVEVRILGLDPIIGDTSRNSLGRILLDPRKWAVLALFTLRLFRTLRGGGYDLVHTTSLKADLIAGFATRCLGIPLLWHIHDRISPDYLPAAVAKCLRFFARTIPSFVVVNSWATRRTLEPFPPGRIEVIHPGVPDEFVSDVVERRVDSEHPIVGIVGRISPTKGQDIFIAAAALVSKRFPKAQFQIIGGPLFNHDAFDRQVRSAVAELGLPNVEFTGFSEDVPGLVRKLSVLVHASPTPEPFGQVVTEAMALGTPVVAINAGGIPEIVVDGESGYLVPPRDAGRLADRICDLLSSPEIAAEMARNARVRVASHFTASNMASRMESIYERMLASSETQPDR